jgi:hypothetical protein
MTESAFVLHVKPNGEDKVPEALADKQVIIGWSGAKGLLQLSLTWKNFVEILHAAYYPDKPDRHAAGSATGNMWRFIREMKIGDLVVVPHGSEFYISRVTSPVTYDPAHGYRRSVRWLNAKKPFPREQAPTSLSAYMKKRATCTDATPLLGEIHQFLASHTHESDVNYMENRFPDQIDDEKHFTEGAVMQVRVNVYERDPSARLECIKAWGISCSVCGFDFERIYGERGAGFIHVHHLRPLSKIGKEYRLNPKADLRPVCPNCHAMIHRFEPPLSIEELKATSLRKHTKVGTR